jgi:hypothetical protein
LGASAIPWDDGYLTPQELTKDQIKKLIQDFVDATIRADKLGFGIIKINRSYFKMSLKFTELTAISFHHSIPPYPTNELTNMEETLKAELEYFSTLFNSPFSVLCRSCRSRSKSLARNQTFIHSIKLSRLG